MLLHPDCVQGSAKALCDRIRVPRVRCDAHATLTRLRFPPVRCTSRVAPRKFRPGIQGLRAVAALLVAIHHFWMECVSGAVDVFFVVSGYLVIGTLLRQVGARGVCSSCASTAALARRLFPNALLVIVFVLVASLFLMPSNP